MHLQNIAIILLLIAGMCISKHNAHAQPPHLEERIEVALRMIGHQVLLSSGDSTSRVLPIKKEDEKYRVTFDAEFGFNPDTLVVTIGRVFTDAHFKTSYILSVEECADQEVVYSYQIGTIDDPDIVPCRSRDIPIGCYSLLFTLLETPSAFPEGETAQVNNQLIALIIVLMLGAILVLLKQRHQKREDPNIIALGDYRFDKRNTELQFKEERIELTSKEADLLLLLFDAANTTITREIILNKVWGDAGDYVGRTLDVFISKLRKKLEADPKVKIVNIRGVGYKLVIASV